MPVTSSSTMATAKKLPSQAPICAALVAAVTDAGTEILAPKVLKGNMVAKPTAKNISPAVGLTPKERPGQRLNSAENMTKPISQLEICVVFATMKYPLRIHSAGLCAKTLTKMLMATRLSTLG